MSHAPARTRTPWIAALLVPIMALAGVLVPASAATAAEGPSITAQAIAATEADGLTVRVVGSDFGDVAGAYAAIIEKGTEAGVSTSGGYAAFGYWMTPGAIVGGAFDKTLTAPATNLDRTTQYEVIVWVGHTTPGADTIYARADVAVSTGQWDAIIPPAPQPEPEPEPTPDAPTLEVSRTTGLDPAGATITITGENFDPTPIGTRPPLSGQQAGFYVQIGWIDSTWRPSEGAGSATRSNAYSLWLQGTNTGNGYALWTINDDGLADFSWTVEIDKAALDAKSRPGATLAVFTLAASGAVLAASELAVPISFHDTTPKLSVDVTEDLEPSGATITITGEDFDTSPIGTRPPRAGQQAGFYVQIGWIDDTWRPSEGAPSSSRSNAYQLWVQGTSTDAGYALWTINDYGRADFSWTVEIDRAALDAKSRPGATLAVFTLAASGAVLAANEIAIPLSFYDDSPKLSVDVTEDLDPAGATITITGRDFDTSPIGTRPPRAGQQAGFYVQIGWIDDTWRPSDGAPSSSRSNAYQLWLQGENTGGGYALWTINDRGLADFSWTVEIDKAALDAKSRPGATLAVFTLAASGAVLAANEIAIPLSFYDNTPKLSVDVTEGLDPEGATLTITGKNYDTSALALYGPSAGQPAGFYAQVGWLDSTWRPSEGAPSSSRSNAYSAWVQGANETSPYLKWAINAYGTADFTWTVEIDQETLEEKSRAGATLAVFTTGAGGVVQAVNELAVPIAFETPGEEPGTGEPGTTTPTPGAGSLTWGVKADFRAYVTGSIAHGSIITSGVGSSAGRYVFPQAGDASMSNGIGSVAYSGSVRFTGHDGALDLSLSEPQIRVDSATSGTLFLRVDGGTRVAFASLALGAGTKTTAADGSVRYEGVPVTLTASGATAFGGFYGAGAALDPVSFVVGSAGAPLGGTIVSARASTTPKATPDATPPATEGITVTGEPVEGGTITAEADGFEPNETGILVVIYSTPTLLADDLTADANGRVSWTGALPLGLAGRHTLTFQGSVDRGIVLDIAGSQQLQCTVADASLVWGFKEAFRAYIDGSIANGEWTTDGDASYETPVFTWSGGTGGADLETGAVDVRFTGSVRFTGHGGVLDTTIANPRVVVDGDDAKLLLDVIGTTREGGVVEATAVEFATLDLSGVEAVREGDTVTWADVPAVLAAGGAEAFGTYPVGEVLDAVTLTATVDSACGDTAAPIAQERVEADAEPISAGDGWPLWATILLIVLVLAAIAAIVAVVIARRRQA